MALRNVQEYHTPATSEETVELLQRHGDGALIVAGGSFIHGLIARGLLTEMDAIIDLGKLPLNRISREKGGVRIGATTTFANVKQDDDLQRAPAFGALRDALRHPPPQVLNVATFGGCVAASCPFFDIPTALLALDARVTAHGPEGTREIALHDFFTGLFDNGLGGDEFVSDVFIPDPGENSASAGLKLEANSNDLAILNTAVWIRADADGKCTEARVFVGGGVGETTVRAASAEQALIGKKLEASVFTEAGEAGRNDVSPITDHRGSAEYRSAITSVFIRRALEQAADRLR